MTASSDDGSVVAARPDHRDHNPHDIDPVSLADLGRRDVAEHELAAGEISGNGEELAGSDEHSEGELADYLDGLSWEPSGDARVDAAVARISSLPGAATDDHVAIYEDAHRQLRDALADLENSDPDDAA